MHPLPQSVLTHLRPRPSRIHSAPRGKSALLALIDKNLEEIAHQWPFRSDQRLFQFSHRDLPLAPLQKGLDVLLDNCS